MNYLHTLIIDDSHCSCILLQKLLAKLGWTSDIATTPEEALRLVDIIEYDLVMSDYNLSNKINGTQLCKQIKAKHDIDCALVSSDEIAAKAHSGFFILFIPKPFNFDDLKNLQVVLSLKNTKKEIAKLDSLITKDLKAIFSKTDIVRGVEAQ
jgi:DNA-binding NtrC family response regulator